MIKVKSVLIDFDDGAKANIVFAGKDKVKVVISSPYDEEEIDSCYQDELTSKVVRILGSVKNVL